MSWISRCASIVFGVVCAVGLFLPLSGCASKPEIESAAASAHGHEIATPLTSYHQHSSPAKAEALARRMVEGESLALVTDSGTPGVSDPGPMHAIREEQ